MPDKECPAPVYANAVVVSVSGYDVLLRFDLSIPTADTGGDEEQALERLTVARVHLPHGNAWAIAHIILANLEKLVTDQRASFVVPKEIITRLGLESEYAELQARAQSEPR